MPGPSDNPGRGAGAGVGLDNHAGADPYPADAKAGGPMTGEGGLEPSAQPPQLGRRKPTTRRTMKSIRNLRPESDRPKMKRVRARRTMGRNCFLMSGRSLAIFIFLIAVEFAVVSAYCQGIFWYEAYDCFSFSGITCTYEACNEANLTVALIVTVCNALIPLFWFFGEAVVHCYNASTQDEEASGRQWQKALDQWEYRNGKNPGSKRVPRHTQEWNKRLIEWNAQQKKIKRALNANTRRRAMIFYIFFFVVGFVLLYIVFTISPQDLNENEDFYDPVVGLFVWQTNGLYDVLLISVMLWEAILFILVLAFVEWPSMKQPRNMTPTTTARETWRLHEQESFRFTDETQSLIPDTVLCIAAHNSCLTPKRQKDFVETLEHAMKLFPLDHIFVCDNGGASHPADRTEEVCREMSRKIFPDGEKEINYLYVPEGNKSHAIYWATELWIPQLFRSGVLPREPTWLMMIDDDVQLPSSLQIPLQTLRERPDTKAISFAIRASSPDTKKRHLWVELQDAEYKVAGAIKQFQSRFGTTLYCHGAIGLWRRDIVGKNILWYHDTEFHGEDMYMGLLLHRMRRDYKIEAEASVVVPTTAPDTFTALFRQRTTSWDLCAHRKVFSYIRFLIFTWHRRTVVLKPFVAYEVMVTIHDYIRIYLLVGLGVRNIIGLGLLFGFYYILTWIEMVMFNKMVLKRRPDLHNRGFSIFLFPFYKTLALTFRYHAMLRNAMMYVSMRRKKFTIADRFETKDGLLPVPVTPDMKVDWWTVWKTDDQPEAEGHSPLREDIEEKILPHIKGWLSAGNRTRVIDLLEGFYRYNKLKMEMTRLRIPDLFKNLGQVDEDSIIQLREDLKDLDHHMFNAAGGALGASYAEAQRRVNAMVEEAHASGRHIVTRPEYRGLVDPNALELYEDLIERVRLAVLDIKWALSRTSYPEHQSQVTGAIHAADNVAESLEIILSCPPFGEGIKETLSDSEIGIEVI